MKTLRNLAKILAVVMIFSLVLSFAACKGQLQLEAFTVDRATVKTVYYVGEELDFSGIKATVRYNDDSLNTEYTFADLTLTYDADITATVGQKSVKVSFLDPHLDVEQSTTVLITVKEDPNAVKHLSYRIDVSGVVTAYVIGDTVDFSAIKVYEKFSNNTELEVTDLSLLTYDVALDSLTATAGNKVVRVKYNGEDAGTITVKVADPEVEKNDVVSAVIGGEFKTSYEVGDTVDLTGMTVTVTYEEGEVIVLTHESLTAHAVDMSTAGKKDVVISFNDPINNEEDFVSFDITVVKRDVVTHFEKPSDLSAFDSDNRVAGTHTYGQSGFAGEFAVGGQLYVIGDDNAFVMLPGLAVDDNGVDKDLEKFYQDVEIYVFVDGEYVLAEKSAINATNYTYTLDGETVATVDTYNGEYLFAKPFDKVKISVKPSVAYYKNAETLNPVVLEAKVIDAYNVYTADELSIIDNSGRQGWVDLKTELGLNSLSPAGIVLHNDIAIKYTNVPADFFYQSTETVVYRNTVTGEIKEYANVAGMNYLVDGISIYERIGTADFVIQGNFFTISVSDFPLVASPSIFGENSEKDYGSDYSNASLFRFATIVDAWIDSADVPVKSSVTIDNLALIGNAGRDNWVVEKVHGENINSSVPELVTAGGLIMLKSSLHSTVTLNNVINNSFFISYFPDYQGAMFANNCKAYDSYQNAAFVWADSYFELNDCFINGTGGPVIIAQSVQPDSQGPHYSPKVFVNNTVTETHVTGQEIWFDSIGATTIVGDIKALGAGLEQLINGAGQLMGVNNLHASFVDSEGKMNIVGALMSNANNATEALTDIAVQGSILTDGTGLNRWYEGELADPAWQALYMAMVTVKPELAGAPILVAYDQNGAPQVLIFNGTGFMDMNGNVIGTDIATQAAIIQTFATADEVVLFQGGLAVLFELYH